MTSTFFQRILLLVLLAGCMTGLHAQEYKYEIGGMAGGAFGRCQQERFLQRVESRVRSRFSL